MPKLESGKNVGVKNAGRRRATSIDRDRDGLIVFFIGVVLLCVAAAVYSLTDLLVAAAPVVMLASGVAIAQLTSNASRRVVGQWGGAGGAVCEDHFAFCGELLGFLAAAKAYFFLFFYIVAFGT